MFNKKLNRLLAIMLASVMGATSLPATQVSADTPSSEYDISNDAASDDISDSKIPDEQDSDNNATEEKQPQQLTVEYTPADDIYVGNKVVPVVKSDRADAAVDNLKYTVVEGKNLIEKDTDFASNGIWTAKDTGTVRIKVTKAEDDKYKSAEAEYTVTIKEYDYSSMNNSLTGTMLQGTQFYVEAPTLSLASDNQAVYVVRKGDEWIEADKYQLMPQQGDNRQTLVIARKDKESGAITDIGSLRLDYKYDTQPPKITLNPKEDDKPAFTKDAVDYYGNVRKVDMNIHDVSLDDGSTQLWVKVDDREEFDVFDVDNAQKLIDAGIEYSEWIVTGADYSSCITFGTKADEEHKYQIRITLFCNDSSEYSMMLNGVRLSIPNTPGRCMVQLDKEVLEAQLFISFEGEKEYERVQKIKSFVDEQNDKYINQKAKVIPEIPKELTLTYIQSQFTESISDDKVIIGLDYTSILPVAVELKSGDVLSLTGKNQTDRETFAKYFMDTIVQKASGNTELYVLDDATKKMGECEFNPNTAMYLTSYHDVPPMIEEINQRIEQRYEMYSAGMFDELEMEPWIILVIDSADIMLNMSGDNKIMKYMKEWLVKYKNMKIFVFMPDIENNSISFNSPEMLKIVKDNRHYMVFDDVCNIKICDISVSASKKYSKPIETGDAYYIKDNELVKIKVVRQS